MDNRLTPGAFLLSISKSRFLHYIRKSSEKITEGLEIDAMFDKKGKTVKNETKDEKPA